MPPLLCDWCKPAPLHHRAQPGSVGALLRCDARISVGRLGAKQVERRAHIDLTAAHAVDQGQVNRRATGMARPVRDIAEPDQIPLGIMPARMPGRIKGRVTMRKTSGGLAPSVPVASSSRLDRPSSPSSGLPCRNSAARRQPAAHHSIRHCPTGQIPTFTLIASGGWRNPFLSGSTSALSWQSGFVEVKLTRLRSSHVHAHKA
jgi:hypothetical protein